MQLLGCDCLLFIRYRVQHHVRVLGVIVYTCIEFHLSAFPERVAKKRVPTHPVTQFQDGRLV